MRPGAIAVIPLRTPLYRGERRLRIALVGVPGGGKHTLFRAVQATSVRSAALAGSQRSYEECAVQIGLDEARLINLPSLRSLVNLEDENRATLKYLLWGDQPAPVSRHDRGGVPAPFERPDVILQVVDATALERHLELTLELMALSRPIVIALNKMDAARRKGLYLSSKALARRLGVPVISTSAARGYGVSQLFRAALDAVEKGVAPLPPRLERASAAQLVAARHGIGACGYSGRLRRAAEFPRHAAGPRRSLLHARATPAFPRAGGRDRALACRSVRGTAATAARGIARRTPSSRGQFRGGSHAP